MPERETPWVGDQVRDRDAGQEGIVNDVRPDGTYVLRPVHNRFHHWTAPNADALEVTVSREERLRLRGTEP
ncbi:hypothetical protein ELQ87_38260 [Streptomyces griseoviridis]|uniref:DUF2171 domain-containing protein n=1 Tax=Streptomyces griseoviridis TaxID=45398 RepID=A0A3S9ZP39_STRGD|nr:hypothetical protein [Streptomyces griseoviridis]AZS89448.1 hypothetical protein ELQ87_38260 [Streptomyces griseoviridis]QCN83710.1 hypothetical protein DDJ31_00975 [Streptomyces griseoviridis]